MDNHTLIMFDNATDLGNWYNQKYTEMGGGWKCGAEESNRLIDWAGFIKDGSKTLLDIGSGDGDFVSHIHQYFDHCDAIDLSFVGVAYGSARNLPNVSFKVLDVENTGYEDQSFDYLTSVGSIEHVIDLDHALLECFRILKDGGKFMCMVPNELWKYLDQPQEQTHTDEEWGEYFVRAGFTIENYVRRGDLTDFLLVK